MAMRAPISPSASAICRPSPREPPVIRALFPFRSNSCLTFMASHSIDQDFVRRMLGNRFLFASACDYEVSRFACAQSAAQILVALVHEFPALVEEIDLYAQAANGVRILILDRAQHLNQRFSLDLLLVLGDDHLLDRLVIPDGRHHFFADEIVDGARRNAESDAIEQASGDLFQRTSKYT